MRAVAAAVALILLLHPICAKPFGYKSYAQFVVEMKAMAAAHPTLLELYTTQERHKLPTAGTCGGSPCQQWVMRLTNRTSLAEQLVGGKSSRPQLFISGELHGDEWVGPHAALESARLLLANHKRSPWLAHLLDSRVIVIMPMANAVGFAGRTREELGVDPNRDFAFDQDPSRCMVTVAGRSMNEVFRSHVFTLAITYHGGDNIVGYEWGDRSHCHESGGRCTSKGRASWISADNAAQKAVASAMRDYAGVIPNGGEGLYRVGACNDPNIIYPVGGGMEDWAYGASWHPKGVKCTPTSFGGYPATQTTYSSATHRCPNFLIETADNKIPPAGSLGTDEDVMTPGGKGGGHVTRNIRLALVGMDSVQPYLTWSKEPGMGAGEPITTGQKISFGWAVGGAYYVDETLLQIAVVDGSGKVLSTRKSRSQSGFGWLKDVKKWSGKGLDGGGNYQATVSVVPIHGKHPEKLWLRVTAEATVDAAWAKVSANAAAGENHPEAHLTRGRTDASWRQANGNTVVQGQTRWFSPPMLIPLAPTTAGGVVETASSHPQSVVAQIATSLDDSAAASGGVHNPKTGVDGVAKLPHTIIDPETNYTTYGGIAHQVYEHMPNSPIYAVQSGDTTSIGFWAIALWVAPPLIWLLWHRRHATMNVIAKIAKRTSGGSGGSGHDGYPSGGYSGKSDTPLPRMPGGGASPVYSKPLASHNEV